ncbi:hypothetical protein BDV27DRAFT_129291 [Aspergillus caelatus]|uniref:Uncharacterized protein n=1 Tax=Aspergillus caelatus TaxID=61420 RepID=A0A5N7A3X8_9EURO|nr:uncharacterized protein BDV27DRAFT_129291 [Aspergillus caelatus]KAE8363896.1 hypothetical protein BDV27DRAFT_129291 [Aspergillus caelatus]
MYNKSFDERDSEVQDCADFTCNATLGSKEREIPSLINKKIVTTTVHSNHIPGVSVVSPFTMNQRQWDLLGQFERSAFLFIKLGGHEGQHVSRRVNYSRMSPEAMDETLQSFENIHLFPLLNERIHNSGEDADAFLEFLQRDIELDIGDCLERFRSGFRRTRPIDAECAGSTISVMCAPGRTKRCESHWFLIFKQQGTETSASLTETGIEWDKHGNRDPEHTITYAVKTDPGLQKLKDCALQSPQFQHIGNRTEHWLCPCALWVSTLIGGYSRKGYIDGISSSGINVEHLHLKLVYSSLEI